MRVGEAQPPDAAGLPHSAEPVQIHPLRLAGLAAPAGLCIVGRLRNGARHTEFSGKDSHMVETALTEGQRKQVFLDLVAAQDHDMSVIQSRQHIAARYDVSESQVRCIEREGLDNRWPPL